MKITFYAGIALLSAGMAFAQGTVGDYRRAFSWWDKFNGNKVYCGGVKAQWIEGNSRFWYVRHTAAGNEYLLVDAARTNKVPLFSTANLAARLAEATGKKVDLRQLPLEGLKVKSAGDRLSFRFGGHDWEYTPSRNALENREAATSSPLPKAREGGKGPAPLYPAVAAETTVVVDHEEWMERYTEKVPREYVSPDKKRAASVRDNNVWIRDVATGQKRALSQDGTPDNYYAAYLQWSPDSGKIAALRVRPAGQRHVYYVESSPTDQLQPKLHKLAYTKPGDALTFKVPCIFDIAAGREIIPSTNLFSQQYNVSWPKWDADSRAITFEYNQRGHQVYRVLELSAESGAVRTLIDETSKTFIFYNNNFRYDTADGKSIIWASERDGYNHLYLYDRATAGVIRQITKGTWYVRKVLRVDEKERRIYFEVSGMHAHEDPYFVHACSIGLDGTDLRELTPEPFMHEPSFSPDGDYLVDVFSSVARPPVSVLRNARTGELLMKLEEADIHALEQEGWRAPESFVAKGRDGKTDIWGILVRPSNFDPAKRYPVIENIYAGPGNQYVPKSFQPHFWDMTTLAELGFIVVKVDGMGTAFRSRSFEDVCWENLKDSGLPDHIAWLKAAAAKYPCMDLGRVGIYGCSAGGQSAVAAMLFHGDFYKAAYAACGCHDNRMDKIWWNEQWMGYPIGKQYEDSSNVVQAHRLQGALMLAVGELDDNVDPASTMQLANALIRANKNFELVVLPGARHTMGERFGEHKRLDFFVKNLYGIDPPKWGEMNF